MFWRALGTASVSSEEGCTKSSASLLLPQSLVIPTGDYILSANESVTDKDRTRHPLTATIPSDGFVVVRRCSKTRMNKPDSRMTRLLMFRRRSRRLSSKP